mmetsp:Transcript_121226/g.387309  ORF Transcript_121226/g.387309 Transcript_121226/m.387309 type:complete len:453 (+) Transcript_121226:1679-3037(+)
MLDRQRRALDTAAAACHKGPWGTVDQDRALHHRRNLLRRRSGGRPRRPGRRRGRKGSRGRRHPDGRRRCRWRRAVVTREEQLGGSLATPTETTKIFLAAGVIVLKAILVANIAAPVCLLLVANVVVALPLCPRLGRPAVLGRLHCLGFDPGIEDCAHRDRRDADVAEDPLPCAGTTLLVAACRRVEPSHGACVLAPVCDAQGHAALQGCGQGLQIAGVARGVAQHDLLGLLHERRAQADQLALPLEELRAHLEGLPRVDAVAAARAIHRGGLPGGLRATDAVAISVLSSSWCVTIVQGGLEGMRVRFHNVDLRAPLAANLVRVAIISWLPPSVFAKFELARKVSRRHVRKVEGEVATAANLPQIYSEAHDLAEQLELRKGLRLPTGLARGERGKARVVLDGKPVAIDGAPAANQIGLTNTIDAKLVAPVAAAGAGQRPRQEQRDNAQRSQHS